MTNQTPLWTIMVYISGDSVLNNFAVESLKQLRSAAGDGVTVEFWFDPNEENEPLRKNVYDGTPHLSASLFKAPTSGKTSLQKGAPAGAPVDMTNPVTLRNFINSVTHPPDSPTHADDTNRHYGLVLWGHGPELLLDAEQPRKSKSGSKPDGKYLTPAKLRDALADTKLLAKKPVKVGQKIEEKASEESSRKLDFIALDACSMSMVEVAAELQGYVDFMIASQDDVPDQSFPYEQILKRLKDQKGADGVKKTCSLIPTDYKNSFQDYFAVPGQEVTTITLASLNLQSVKSVTSPLEKLVDALENLADALHKSAFASVEARKAIIHARSESRDFVLGLYVDIYDFCQNLQNEEKLDADLTSICKDICVALDDRSQKGVVLDNQTIEQGEAECHGLSIYLPYLTAKESKKIEKSLTTTIGGTGIVTQMSKGGSPSNLHKSRAARIAETEEDLASLTRFSKWSDFIKCTWSYILAKEEPMELDLHYSAQQCLLNLRSLWETSSKSSGVAA